MMRDPRTWTEDWILRQREDLMLIAHHESELRRLSRRVRMREREMAEHRKQAAREYMNGHKG